MFVCMGVCVWLSSAKIDSKNHSNNNLSTQNGRKITLYWFYFQLPLCTISIFRPTNNTLCNTLNKFRSKHWSNFSVFLWSQKCCRRLMSYMVFLNVIFFSCHNIINHIEHTNLYCHCISFTELLPSCQLKMNTWNLIVKMWLKLCQK